MITKTNVLLNPVLYSCTSMLFVQIWNNSIDYAILPFHIAVCGESFHVKAWTFMLNSVLRRMTKLSPIGYKRIYFMVAARNILYFHTFCVWNMNTWSIHIISDICMNIRQHKNLSSIIYLYFFSGINQVFNYMLSFKNHFNWH